MTGELAIGILLAHLLGDYVFQSDWMATEKLSRWWPAIVHGLTYTVPYVLLAVLLGGISVWALVVIGGTHIVIDRYRLAKYLVWLKNQVGARREYAWFTPYRKGPRVDPMAWPPTSTGYPANVPVGLATALMIVADNTIHLVINWAAVLWL